MMIAIFIFSLVCKYVNEAAMLSLHGFDDISYEGLRNFHHAWHKACGNDVARCVNHRKILMIFSCYLPDGVKEMQIGGLTCCPIYFNVSSI